MEKSFLAKISYLRNEESGGTAICFSDWGTHSCECAFANITRGNRFRIAQALLYIPSYTRKHASRNSRSKIWVEQPQADKTFFNENTCFFRDLNTSCICMNIKWSWSFFYFEANGYSSKSLGIAIHVSVSNKFLWVSVF